MKDYYVELTQRIKVDDLVSKIMNNDYNNHNQGEELLRLDLNDLIEFVGEDRG